MKKRIVSFVLCIAVLCGVFAVAAPSVSAADIDYPWMYMTNYNDDFYVGDVVDLKFTMFREYNNEIYYVKVYDSDGYLIASCSKTVDSGYSSIVDYTVTWDTNGNDEGVYKVVTSSEFYSLYRWNVSPNTNTYYITLKKRVVAGWNSDSVGWWYVKSDNTECVNEWLYLKGCWYYFDNNGYMVTGWESIGGSWYYFNNNGAMQTGWQKIGSTWYYLNTGGNMSTGWQKIGSSWYYFGTSGAMHTGWQKIGSSWYYLNTGGNMSTGWQKIGSNWYYFNAGGSMATGWLKLGSTWYYFNAGGSMATGWQKIGSTWYYFNAGGAWVK